MNQISLSFIGIWILFSLPSFFYVCLNRLVNCLLLHFPSALSLSTKTCLLFETAVVTSHYSCLIGFFLLRFHVLTFTPAENTLRYTFRTVHDRVSLWEEYSSVLSVTALVTQVPVFVGLLHLAKNRTAPSVCRDHVKTLCIYTR